MSFPKGRKIVIVGGVAGGGSTATRLRRLDESATIVMYEKGSYVSFANCGLPYYVGNVITDEANLLVSNPAQFKSWFNIDVRTNHEVLSINREKRSIMVKNLTTNEVFEDTYDKLVLSPGSKPIVPNLPGCSLPGVFQLRDIPDSNEIRGWIENRQAKKAVIVGGGFIGLEMAENLHNRGLDVSIVEMAPHVMPLLHDELATLLEDAIKEKGIHLVTGNGLKNIEKGEGNELVVVCSDDMKISCDLILLAIGVRPCSDLAKEAGLELGIKGAIKVDETMKTSDDNIYAVGDAVQVKDYVTGLDTHVPLAGPANRQGRIVADVLCGLPSTFRGVQGTSVCGMFDLCVAMTGQTAAMLKRNHAIPEDAIGSVCVHAANHAGYYPGSSMIHLDLTFNCQTGAILGAQAVGNDGVDKRIDVVSSYIHMKGTVNDLVQAELCYAPPFGAAKDIVNLAGMVAQNICNGLITPASWEQCFNDEDGFKLDVRGPAIASAKPIPGFTNVPLGTIRDRMEEIPKEKVIYVTCNVGRTAYYASRILIQNGYDARLLPGGWNTYRILPKKN